MENNFLKTEICSLLGIDYPIIQGAMVWISRHQLVSAVSNAGGLGVIAGGSCLSKEELKNEIKKTREMTKKPFAVNIPLINPGADWMAGVCLDEGIEIIVTSAGSPKVYTQSFKSNGAKVLHVSPSPRLAKKAEDAGVDAIIAEGVEAGGHDSPDEITSMVLIPQVVDAVSKPVVAAGGIADGRGLLSAFMLGAKGIQMGTRFIATKEAPVHNNFKNAIINAKDNDTVLTGRILGTPVRVIKNKLALEILELEKKGVSPPELLEFIGPGRSRLASIEGDVENGTVQSGQIAGMINDISSVKDVIDRIMKGAQEILERLNLS